MKHISVALFNLTPEMENYEKYLDTLDESCMFTPLEKYDTFFGETGRIVHGEDWCFSCGRHLIWSKAVCTVCYLKSGLFCESINQWADILKYFFIFEGFFSCLHSRGMCLNCFAVSREDTKVFSTI